MIEKLFHPCFSLEIHWRGRVIRKTVLQNSAQRPKNCSIFSPEPSRVLQALARRYRGHENILWLYAPLDWQGLTPFQARVLRTLFWLVPWGRTVSYSRLAALAGSAGAARAVGGVMAKNPWPVLIPCHRVLGTGRNRGGFSAGAELKTSLLNLEL